MNLKRTSIHASETAHNYLQFIGYLPVRSTVTALPEPFQLSKTNIPWESLHSRQIFTMHSRQAFQKNLSYLDREDSTKAYFDP